ncbi:MAG: RagB/SusD family nutrient uptake outer membrane protein [Gemmatimonadales bacterium]
MRQTHVLLLLAALGSGACSFDLNTNPNAPDAIGDNPGRAEISATANGMLLALRSDVADFALDVGILGREALRFDGADPRFTGELLQGPLDAGGTAFGGDHWAEEFSSIRTGNNLLAVLQTAQALTAEEQSAASGYVKTLQALDFLLILDTHTQDSIPIDVGTDVTAPPAPFVTNAAAFAHVNDLLDQGQAELAAGGAAFPFVLPSGFAGFDTPATFTQFNRSLRARVAVYQNQFADALTALAASFIDPAGPLDRGVYMSFGTGAGDFANPLAIDPETGPNLAHPSLQTGAQLQTDGVTPDQRFVDKIIIRQSSASSVGLTSNLGWIRYPTPTTPIPLIKNEELILLRAEANIGLNDLGSALTDINTVRTISGGLPALGGFADADAALTELLYNKLYSLMYEGGTRWIDARHYGRLSLLPNDRPSGNPPDVIFSTLPIPNAETLPRQ